MCTGNKSSNTISFGLGALLGAGVGFFLSTKKGRKLVKEAWKEIEPYIDDAVDTAKDEFEEVKGKVKVKADELKQKAGELKSQAQKTFEDLEDRADGIKDRTQVLRDRAEDGLEYRVSQIKDIADEKLPPSIKRPIKRTFFKGV